MFLKLAPAACLLFACFAMAHADTYLFSFSTNGAQPFGSDPTATEGLHTITFLEQSSPTPVESDFTGFVVAPGSVTMDGVTVNDIQLSFGSDTPTFGGVQGFCAYVSDPLCSDYNTSFILNGASVYTGTPDQPTFVTGTYQISSSVLGHLDLSGGDSTLTISEYIAPSAVTPEPSAVTLFGTGLLAASGVLRRRKLGSHQV